MWLQFHPTLLHSSSLQTASFSNPLLRLWHGPSSLDWLYLLSQRGAVGIQSVSLSQASFPLISLDYRLLKGRACDWLSLYTHMGEEGVLVDAQGSSSQCHGRIQEELGLVMAPKGGTRWCCSILHIWITSPGWGPSFLRWLWQWMEDDWDDGQSRGENIKPNKQKQKQQNPQFTTITIFTNGQDLHT